jgi:hypothetical protein
MRQEEGIGSFPKMRKIRVFREFHGGYGVFSVSLWMGGKWRFTTFLDLNPPNFGKINVTCVTDAGMQSTNAENSLSNVWTE